ncbi:MAG TPA: peroxidase-related enzyme [Candidatus Dormibacteraeota bacterium]|nr:peroxidase-related enzyme [Candidatus Dormibacteraeota bacterium]
MSETRPISRFPIPALDDLPPDIRARIEDVRERTGFVPNVFLALAHRPEEWRAFFAYHDALMEREGGLSKADRELIVVATSAANHCLYCVVAHGALARIRARNPLIADQVAVDWRNADLSDRQRAMLAFAVKLATQPAEVDEQDLERLRAHGFDDDEIWDIGAITALFALSNRLAHLSQLRPNDEFYLMGRVPKEVYERLTGP